MRWSQQEDRTLLDYAQRTGNRFDTRTCPLVPGRTSNACQNRMKRLVGLKHDHRAGARKPHVPIPVHWEEPAQPSSPEHAGKGEPDALLEGERALLEAVNASRDGVPLEELCDRLGMPPGRVRDLVARAKARGLRVDIAGDGAVGAPPPHYHSPQSVYAVNVQQAGERRMFFVAGDPHIGNVHHKGPQLHDFVDKAMARAKAMGIHHVVGLCVGDILDGVYPFARWEQYAQGFDQQAQAAADGGLPRREGLRWMAIAGNHDETFEDRSGMIVGKALEEAFRARGRDDLEMLSPRGAYVRLIGPGEDPRVHRGVFVELWHPRGSGGAYAVSYKLQKHVESYQPGQKPDFLFTGHYHQHGYFHLRGVHTFHAGCWQGGQSSFGKSIGGAPSIGSWIVTYAQTPGGTVRDVDIAWISYPEVETVRELQLG